MTLKQAIKIVEKHQKWRRSYRTDRNGPKMVDVAELGKAIDILLFIAKIYSKFGNTDKFHIKPTDL